MKQSEMLAALKELHSDLLRYAAGSDSIVPGAYAEALDVAIEQFEKKWTSVKDKLPRPLEKVLCIWKDNRGTYYGFATYQHDDVWYVDNQGMPKVVCWMPLPEMPKGRCMTPEIKHALEVIRDECRKHETCSDECPLCISGNCPIMEGYNPWECDKVWEDESNG